MNNVRNKINVYNVRYYNVEIIEISKSLLRCSCIAHHRVSPQFCKRGRNMQIVYYADGAILFGPLDFPPDPIKLKTIDA